VELVVQMFPERMLFQFAEIESGVHGVSRK